MFISVPSSLGILVISAYLFLIVDCEEIVIKIYCVLLLAKLTAVIAVGHSYPNIPPLFSLIIENEGKKYTVDNCSNLRVSKSSSRKTPQQIGSSQLIFFFPSQDMEKEVNVHVDELIEKLEKRKNWILASQLQKLAICFDIFLECTDPDNFPREKLFYFRVRYEKMIAQSFWNERVILFSVSRFHFEKYASHLR